MCKHCTLFDLIIEGHFFFVEDITDITVYEVTGPNMLREIHQACGVHYGGNTVNAEFIKFLTTLLGTPVIEEICDKHPSEFFDLMTTFEHKKTLFTVDEKSKVTIRISAVFMDTFKVITGETLEEALLNSTFNDTVKIRKDLLTISNDLFRKFFDCSINIVLGVFEELFRKPEIKNITTLLAVGGGFESSVLINATIQRFPNITVIVPEEPNLAVLKGAVLFGFEPLTITKMVCIFAFYLFDKSFP